MRIDLLTESEIIYAVNALHEPDAINDLMVYEVWEDGEITITKGGDLYGKRTLHLDTRGDSSLALPWDSLAMKHSKHSRIACKDRETALKARRLIIGM